VVCNIIKYIPFRFDGSKGDFYVYFSYFAIIRDGVRLIFHLAIIFMVFANVAIIYHILAIIRQHEGTVFNPNDYLSR